MRRIKWFPILLILTVILACMGFVFVMQIGYEPFCPMSYTFDEKTGIITFYIDETYDLIRVDVENGYIAVPDYNRSTHVLSFNINEIPTDQDQRDAIRFNGIESNGSDRDDDRKDFNINYVITRHVTYGEVIVQREIGLEIESQTFQYVPNSFVGE